MIYALTDQNAPDIQRGAIASALRERDMAAVHGFVDQGVIVHVMDVGENEDVFCVYCRIPVFRSVDRPPAGLVAHAPWHFEHRRMGHHPGECVGHTRQPPTPHALGIKNPRGHGCYVQLGCEHLADRHRSACQTIANGATYCHHAAGQHCVA